ncbi:hypothetical protein N431DRAFT_448847 [Stipitochalara longipes BDJ]|nr:hypothetical protein N431DRAFT_448847 [Stipitochalara longipes BDJ]
MRVLSLITLLISLATGQTTGPTLFDCQPGALGGCCPFFINTGFPSLELGVDCVNGTLINGPTTTDPNNVWGCANTTLTPACCAAVVFVQKRTEVIEVVQKRQNGPYPPFNPWYCQPPEVTVTTTSSTSATFDPNENPFPSPPPLRVTNATPQVILSAPTLTSVTIEHAADVVFNETSAELSKNFNLIRLRIWGTSFPLGS